jgi:flagellar motor switch protein FliN
MSDTPTEETPGTKEDTNIEQTLDQAAEAVAVQTSELEALTEGATDGENVGLGSLLDVPVQITVHVGRTRITLGELVNLTPGSLLELDREANEPADILVNGKVVARGEIVTIDDSYGVRVTDVDS